MAKECSSCSKEPLRTIPIARIIDKIDSLFDKNDVEEAGRILDYWEKEAKSLGDDKGLLEIYSEELGYYRKVNNREKGLSAVEGALSILTNLDKESVPNATIYLNCATTLKAFGKVNDAIKYYNIAKAVYEKSLEKDDFRLAGLYNNFATALQELKNYDDAKGYYLKAIDVLKSKGVCVEIAVSYVNLAQTVFDEGQEKEILVDEEIDKYLNLAYETLNDPKIDRDGNYAFVCSKCAPAFGYFGYFIIKDELEKRAKEIYNK